MTTTLLLWLVIGALLIAGELMTGTFYLLIFGIAAWIGAGTAFAGYGLDAQLAAAGATVLAGLAVVTRYGSRWRGGHARSEADLDVGNEVRIETVDGPRLKVHYRGSTWDAVVENGDAAGVSAGDFAIIRAVRGNSLVVRPAPRR